MNITKRPDSLSDKFFRVRTRSSIPGMVNRRIQGCMSPSAIQKNLFGEILEQSHAF